MPDLQQNSEGLRVKLVISYDGTNYLGWQRQRLHRETIQETLENSLKKLFKKQVGLHGSGRTDTGVHALAQVAHFDPPRSIEQIHLIKAINRFSPQDIVVQEAYLVPTEFHSLHSAIGKLYRYRILNRPYRCPLRRAYTTWIPQRLDLNMLQELTTMLVGEHDFRSFQSSGSNVKTTTRKLFSAAWQKVGSDEIHFLVHGSGFLKQMVRNLVGTMVELTLRNEPTQRFAEILLAQDRRKALKSAPPQGLVLERVYYSPELDKKCRKLYE